MNLALGISGQYKSRAAHMQVWTKQNICAKFICPTRKDKHVHTYK